MRLFELSSAMRTSVAWHEVGEQLAAALGGALPAALVATIEQAPPSWRALGVLTTIQTVAS